ncbi:hypothetical protein H2198_003415 [Neophaeococcomyces mojaviensis]|uniref:Uncharacterized protein n=1 Tax=Neophaeococcomyces mojaviensis TaxID=3383035 RepID=A0ACC3ABY8_9EURO|nr:hypothetical protein H2198_003415 [Knufia sp. JES_112]
MDTPAAHTLSIENQQYLLWATKVSLKSQLFSTLGAPDQDFILVTAVSWDKSEFGKDDLEEICYEYEQTDDVWCRSFLSLVLLLQPPKTKCATSGKRILKINNLKAKLPAGPLAIQISTGQVLKVAKLQSDTHAAFASSIIPNQKAKAAFTEFSRSESVQIPLPSRLYYPKREDKPLHGVRIAVKDTIALKGLRTSFGSAPWLETYPPELASAPCVQKLIDAGAVIVGQTKTTEFAEGLNPSDWIHTSCPFNPRGDGQQKTSSSSTGSASASAAYEWLDVSLGTDTGGSIRHPAGVNGLYGQRPSHGRIDLTGVLGATDLFNTVGIFARDVELFSKVGGFLVEGKPMPRPLPSQRRYNLLYPTRASHMTNPIYHGQYRWFPHPEVDQSHWSEAEKQLEQTVARMEKLLDCKRIPFNINELWRATPVLGQPRSLDEATGEIYQVITTSSAIHTGIDDFIAKYKSEHDGEEPLISEIVKQRLDYGRSVQAGQVAKAVEAMEAFREWTLNTLFGSYDQNATTIMVFPQTCGLPDYRNDVPVRGETFNSTFSIYALGYLVGCPDYTLPVAETPYTSKVTGQTEHLPVTLSLVGRPGTDLELFDVVDYLHQNGALSDVLAGPRVFQN